jgi:hypothetical protein
MNIFKPGSMMQEHRSLLQVSQRVEQRKIDGQRQYTFWDTLKVVALSYE